MEPALNHHPPMSDICKHGLRGDELLVSALKRFRARMAEEMRQEQTSLDFFVSHGQFAGRSTEENNLSMPVYLPVLHTHIGKTTSGTQSGGKIRSRR